jgi:hypothetical protein
MQGLARRSSEVVCSVGAELCLLAYSRQSSNTVLCTLMHADKCAADCPATSDGPTLVLTRELYFVPSECWNTG